MQPLTSITDGLEAKMRPRKYEDLRELVADLRKDNDCLLWEGGTHPQGYPMFRWQGKMQQVARVLMEDALGKKLDRRQRVKRTCGNVACCNVDHLMVAEPYTEEWKCVGKSITEDVREQIRTDYFDTPYYWGKNTRLAEKYDIGISTFYKIIGEKRIKKVDE